MTELCVADAKLCYFF